jgi:DedD protein
MAGETAMALRDFDRVQERIELRIEVRHIVQLLVVFLLATAGAFYAGYKVGDAAGKAHGQAQCPPATLAAEAMPLAVPPTATAAEPGPVVPAAAPTPTAVLPGAGPDAETPLPDTAAESDAQVAPDVPPDVAVAVDSAVATDIPPAADVPVAADVSGHAAKPAPASDKPGQVPDKEEEAEAADAAQKRADLQAPRTPRAGKPAPQRVEAPVLAKSKYVIQIKAFRNEVDAAAFAKSLQDKGHAVVLSTIEVPDKGQFWRVRLGPFDSLEQARAAQKRFEAAEGHTTMILAQP